MSATAPGGRSRPTSLTKRTVRTDERTGRAVSPPVPRRGLWRRRPAERTRRERPLSSPQPLRDEDEHGDGLLIRRGSGSIESDTASTTARKDHYARHVQEDRCTAGAE